MIPSKPISVALSISIVVCAILFAPSPVERHQAPPNLLLRPMPKQRFTLLVVGDSLSISVAEQLEQYFSKYADRVELQRMGKVSSGLARPDFFDWEQNLQELVWKWNPGIVVIMIGTNDNKPLRRNQESLAFGTDPWRREYRVRLQHLYDICRRKNPAVRVFWIGAPIMRDSLLARELTVVNQTIEAWCRGLPACEYVSTWSALADKDGRFVESFDDEETGKSVSIRTKDGVHLAPHGSLLLARVAIEAIHRYYAFDQ